MSSEIAPYFQNLATPLATHLAPHAFGPPWTVADHAVIIDTTASEFVSNMYDMWLGKGVHVVTPNKKVGPG